MSQQIFLSYSRTDRDACIALRSALQQAGLTVFHDEEAIRTGDRWLTRLEEALQQCSAFIVLVGRDGVQRWVGAEVQTALIRHLSPHDEAQRLPIYPILLEAANPESLPPFLALFQFDRWSPSTPLPDHLIEAIRARSSRIDSRHTFEGCPFLGLSAFSRNDAQLFFGRRQETLEALTYLGDQQQINPDKLLQTDSINYTRWLQIEGNSGSGKSSLMSAGMLPMIEQGSLWARTGFEHWCILGPMMPGKDPVAKLAETLEHGLIIDPSRRDIDARLERLHAKESGLASTLKNFKQAGSAFLLIVDQLEELFTFAHEAARKQFDALLAYALQDTECPLFLISTVRADFLDRFEYLPNLQAIYNRQCKRYFLPLISEQGLREIIEQPARLAGLDVSEITTAMLDDAKDEIGALPLVENALSVLWQQRKNHRLSGDDYRQQGGIAGMLSSQADALLQRIDQAVPKGKQAALELLLRLTRINDQGRHTRQRITREEGVFTAGNGNDSSGEQIVRMLSGERPTDILSSGHSSVSRLITLNQEQGKQYVDLIHETLIRARSRDPQTRKWLGYWPTLYDYIEKNRNRDIYRQQLKYETEQWQQSKGLGRVWNLTFVGLNKYRALRIPKNTPESSFLAWSRRARNTLIVLLMCIVLYGAESYYWTVKHELPPNMMWTQQRFRFGYAPLTELTEKPLPADLFNLGEQDAAFIAILGESKKNFGAPGKPMQIAQPFYLGKYEVTYDEYDYYVWQHHRSGNTEIAFPDTTAKGWRGDRPVVNVNWLEAAAYAVWYGKQKGKECRLPTEAEWEYAARAGSHTAYHWGDDVHPIIDGKPTVMANCMDCGSQWDGKQSAPVGRFAPNQFGLYDMSGNVWEWTCSNWRDQFDGSEQQCNDDATDAEFRVVRGGSWLNHKDGIRSSARLNYHPDVRYHYFGFRVLCESPIE